jgi:predicted anti-sigma-YlaC factor YlaD
MEECKGFKEQLSLYIDGMLTQQESVLLEEHIKICENCREDLSMLRQVVDSCKGLAEKEPPEYLYPMIVSSLRRSRKRTWIGSVQNKWLKPGLVSIAAVLLVAVAVKGIMPGMMNQLASKDMAATEQAAPAAEARLRTPTALHRTGNSVSR